MRSSSALRFALLVSALAGVLLGGCASPFEQRTLDGVHALDACDVRGAAVAFGDAHAMDPAHADVAFAFALSELAVLVEDPAIVALAPRFGFDRPIDSSLLWGPDGVLDLLSRHEDCESVGDLLRAEFPHPSVRADGPSFWTTVDPTLTIGDVRVALVALSPRLERIIAALETAAGGMGEEGVTLSGGCGLGAMPTRVQAPELLALATALQAVRATTQVALAYDGALRVDLLFNQGSRQVEWANMMNDHMLRVTDAGQLEASRAMLTRVATLGRRAVTSARSITTHRTDAVFDWTALPPSILDDVDAFGAAAETALQTDEATTIPRMTPALGLRVGSFLTDPIDFGSAGPLWSVEEDMFGSFVRTDGERLESILAPRFSENIFETTAPSRSFMIDWSFEDDPFGRTFNPGDRWSTTYSCP